MKKFKAWKKPVAILALLGAAIGNAAAQTVANAIAPAEDPQEKSLVADPGKGFLFLTEGTNGGPFGIVNYPVGKAIVQVKGFMNPARSGADGKGLQREWAVTPSVRYSVNNHFSVGPAVFVYKSDSSPWNIQPGVQMAGGAGRFSGSAAFFAKTSGEMGLVNLGSGFNLDKKGNNSINGDIALTPHKTAFWDVYYQRSLGKSKHKSLVLGAGQFPLRHENFIEAGVAVNHFTGLFHRK